MKSFLESFLQNLYDDGHKGLPLLIVTKIWELLVDLIEWHMLAGFLTLSISWIQTSKNF